MGRRGQTVELSMSQRFRLGTSEVLLVSLSALMLVDSRVGRLEGVAQADYLYL